MSENILSEEELLEIVKSLEKSIKFMRQRDYSRETYLSVITAAINSKTSLEAARINALGLALTSPVVMRNPAMVESILKQLGIEV